MLWIDLVPGIFVIGNNVASPSWDHWSDPWDLSPSGTLSPFYGVSELGGLDAPSVWLMGPGWSDLSKGSTGLHSAPDGLSPTRMSSLSYEVNVMVGLNVTGFSVDVHLDLWTVFLLFI